MLILALSPFGKQKLGSPEDVPEFSRWAWIAMLYSAGMGAGILLRAVQEPVFMQQNPPIQTGTSVEIIALEYTFYQWGFTAWAFYGLFALIIGYYLFTKKRSALISASIQSLTKHKAVTHSIDILATVTTVFGLVGAVGLGTTQINGGLNHVTQGDFGLWTTIGITVCIAILAFLSVW
jgi:glycine betaine transporter